MDNGARLKGLPSGDLMSEGLADYQAGRETAAALLVAMTATPGTSLWTFDRRLAQVVAALGLAPHTE